MNAEKERIAIERFRTFVPQNGEPYYLCYSGGKDSDVIRILAQLADVPHEIHHNLTTVDTPETMQYIKSIPGVIIDRARYADGTPKTMWNLIPHKLIPPTRIARYCCSELKEWGGLDECALPVYAGKNLMGAKRINALSRLAENQKQLKGVLKKLVSSTRLHRQAQ